MISMDVKGEQFHALWHCLIDIREDTENRTRRDEFDETVQMQLYRSMHRKSFVLIQHTAQMHTDSSLLLVLCKMNFAQFGTLIYGSYKKHCTMHFLIYVGQVVAWYISDLESAEVITILLHIYKQF